MLTIFGYFLNKCNQDVRKDIIDRLIQLQTNEIEVSDYKVIDIDLMDDIQSSIEETNEIER